METRICGDGRYGCGEAKQIEEFPFIEGSITERTILCSSCIGERQQQVKRTGATLPVVRLSAPEGDPLEQMSAQRRWYYNHREHIKEQARARYYAQEGKPVPVKKRIYVKRTGVTDPRIGSVTSGMLQAEGRYELERKLVKKMAWVAQCMAEYMSFRNSSSQNAEGAAYHYKVAVQDEEKIRDSLGMEPRELTGIAESDVEFFALQTNEGDTSETETTSLATSDDQAEFNVVTEGD